MGELEPGLVVEVEVDEELEDGSAVELEAGVEVELEVDEELEPADEDVPAAPAWDPGIARMLEPTTRQAIAARWHSDTALPLPAGRSCPNCYHLVFHRVRGGTPPHSITFGRYRQVPLRTGDTSMDGVVELRNGQVRGVRRAGCWSFSGIPYATSGAQRWHPPAPPESWTGVRDCAEFGPVSPQPPPVPGWSPGGEPSAQSEECLTLNVWTPELDGARRPVMVWVHGGAFVSGSGAGALYRGGLLAAGHDVVVVTINYRLGMLGFLAHPALEQPGLDWLGGREWSGWGNWGLADQVAALEWISAHIAGFGGDPGNVTLFGESAGAMSVSDLLGAPAARGLFHKAIVESGPPVVFSPDAAVRRAEECAALLGVPLTRSALQQVPADELVRAVQTLRQPTGDGTNPGLAMMPVVDGGLLPEHPMVAVASGACSHIPLLIGTNRDEFAFFVIGDPRMSAMGTEDLRRWVRRLAGDDTRVSALISEVERARTRRGEPVGPRDLWTAIATEYVFRVPSIRFADAHARAGSVDGAGSGRSGAGTYVYLFTWETPAFGGSLGSCHALEIPFVMGTVANPAVQAFSGGGEDALSLSKVIQGAWVRFARFGDPGEWSQWSTDRRPTEILGPWPGASGLRHRVYRPRDEELEAVGTVAEA